MSASTGEKEPDSVMLGSDNFPFLGVLSECLLGLPLSYSDFAVFSDIAILFKVSTLTQLGEKEDGPHRRSWAHKGV